MAEQWYYTKDGQRAGPVSDEQLRELVTAGKVQAADLVWKTGMPQWVQASQFFPPPAPAQPDPNAPPPIPNAPSQKGLTLPADFSEMLNPKNRLVLGYRIGLAVAFIAVFLPWAQASGSSSIMGNVHSASASVSGINTTWGMLTILVALGGAVLSFLNPAAILKDKATLGMAAVGVVIVLLAIIGMATAASHFGKGVNFADAYGNQASSSAGAGFGIYLTLIAGLATGGLGFVNKWGQ